MNARIDDKRVTCHRQYESYSWSDFHFSSLYAALSVSVRCKSREGSSFGVNFLRVMPIDRAFSERTHPEESHVNDDERQRCLCLWTATVVALL